MSEDINVLLKEVDVQKEQLSALRPLPEGRHHPPLSRQLNFL